MADYDINAVTRRKVFTGSAGTGPYAFTFEILTASDIVVYFNATKLTLTTDFTVAINANGTGSVTIVVNAGGNVPQTPVAADQIVVIGARDIERTTDFVTAGDLLASSLNEQLDALTIFDQQIAEENQRGMRAPPYDPALVEDGGVVDMTLPAKASRAGKTLAFDSDGNPTVGEDIGNWRGDWAAGTAYTVRDLVKDPVNESIYRVNTAHTSSGTAPISGNADVAKFDLVIDATAVADAEAAQAAAEAAQAAAETAETNAASSATSSANSATASASSATASAASESAAATSEANASTSESNAASSATASANSATASASSATASAASASAASTSESNASTSESNAASSASSASTSAATATTQAGIATTKAGEASTSASNAATSETNAETAKTAAEAARDAIQQFYLGAQSSNPTVDGNGDPVTAGDWYFNTGDNTTRIYNGSSWQITAIAAGDFLTVSNNLSDLASAATSRTNLGLEIGTDVMAYDATMLVDADIGSSVQAYDADTAKLDVAQSFTAAQRGSTQVAGSITGSTTLDFGTYQNFVLTLTGSITLANPTTEVVGQSGFITFIQTGGYTVSLGTDYETAGGAGITLSASGTDIVPYVVAASGRILLGAPQLAFA